MHMNITDIYYESVLSRNLFDCSDKFQNER